MESIIITALIIIGSLMALGLVVWLVAVIFAAKQFKKLKDEIDADFNKPFHNLFRGF